jgi:hypothetical protein
LILINTYKCSYQTFFFSFLGKYREWLLTRKFAATGQQLYLDAEIERLLETFPSFLSKRCEAKKGPRGLAGALKKAIDSGGDPAQVRVERNKVRCCQQNF